MKTPYKLGFFFFVFVFFPFFLEAPPPNFLISFFVFEKKQQQKHVRDAIGKGGWKGYVGTTKPVVCWEVCVGPKRFFW